MEGGKVWMEIWLKVDVKNECGKIFFASFAYQVVIAFFNLFNL